MAGTAQFLVPGDAGIARIEGLLADARIELAPGPAETADRTYYDTFDGLLDAAGHVIALEAGRLVLLDAASARELAAAPWPADAGQPDRLLAGDLPAGPLRDLVAPAIDVRALRPTARVRSRRRAFRVLNDDAKTVVRLVAEEASVRGAGRRRHAIAPRLHVLGVRGYDRAFARVTRTLERDLGFAPAGATPYEEAVRLAGGTPGGVSSKLDLTLDPDQRADAAAQTVMRRLLQVIDANLPGTLDDVDSEFLHDLRVAIRRTRALQRELRGVFPPERLEHFRSEFRRLQQVTGPTRDLDVYVLEFTEFVATLPAAQQADIEPLRTVLEQRLRRERRRMERELRSDRTRTALAGWAALADALPDLDAGERPDAQRDIGAVAAERIAKVHRQMVRAGGRIDDASPAEDLHDLRKKGKELRYLLEFFATLFPRDTVQPLVRSLKALQDTLGRFQDREIQAGMVRSLGDAVAKRAGGADALMAMGVLNERLDEQQAQARAEFAERFAAFATKQQRTRVKETFR